MQPIRWGILGPGWIARHFASDLIANGMHVVAVGSRSADKARAFADDLGIARSHGSYQALAADPEVDAIYVATPHPLHLEHATLAIEAGKHVLVEKPVTLNARQAKTLYALAAQHDVVALEAMWTRFLPHMIRLREIIASGAIGSVQSLFAAHRQLLPSDPTHRINDPALGGGALLDLGIYPLALAFDLLGEPQTIKASGRLKPTGVDAEVSAILRYANGASAQILAASDFAGGNGAEINGTEGYVEIDSYFYAPTTFRVFDSQGSLRQTFSPTTINGRGMHFQALELERLAVSGERISPLLTPQQSIDLMTAMDEIRRQIGVAYLADHEQV